MKAKLDEPFATYSWLDLRKDSIAGLIAYRYRCFKYLEARNIPIHDKAKSTLITALLVMALPVLAITSV